MRRVLVGAVATAIGVAAWFWLGGEAASPETTALPSSKTEPPPPAPPRSNHGDAGTGAGRAPAGRPRDALPPPEVAEPVAVAPVAPAAASARDRALADLDAELAAYVDLPLAEGFHPDLPREEQNAILARALATRAEASVALQEAYAELAEVHDEVGALALVRLAEVHEEMAHAIEAMPQPSYLSELQAAHYRDAMLGKAQAQLEEAAAALAEAEALAVRIAAGEDVRAAIVEARATLGD